MPDLLLLSGGVDSTCLAALGANPVCITIDYGQIAAEGEIRASSAVSAALGLEHHVLRADCSAIGSGLLAGGEADPQAPSVEWWPFRNQLLVTLAAAFAFGRGLRRVMVGSVRTDSFHRDGTAGFYANLDVVVSQQEGEIRVVAPAIELTTLELVQKAGVGADLLGWTFSCHAGTLACGACPGCVKRRQTFATLGLL